MQQRVLLAHQSTIPHYRVAFYNELERLRPESWCFDVVFDLAELQEHRFFDEAIDIETFDFPLLTVDTFSIQVRGKRISYQTFWRRAADYDLIVGENAVNNLSYPLCQIYQLRGKKYAYWGHGRDHSLERQSLPKEFSEKLKLILAKWADGFFAYTSGVKDYLIQKGMPPEKVFVVNNTIDINLQRELFDQWRAQRADIRQRFGLRNKKTLLFVGRFTANKRIDFLLDSFTTLRERDPAYHLLLVGSGGDFYDWDGLPDVTYLGSIVEPEQLAKVYVASDLFSFPGAVGLGPLQALCYDLPVVTIDSSVQMPEIDYLNEDNALILPVATTPKEYAESIFDLFENQVKLQELRQTVWPSIRHLTIEQMAQNFIHGINTILATSNKSDFRRE